MKVGSTQIAVSLGLLALSAAAGATPYPTKGMPAAADAGALTAQANGADITVTLPLKVRDAAAAEALLQAVSDRTSPSFHQFLTPAQFKARFGQSDADVAAADA